MRPRLLLLRHGVTLWNREGRFQGHRDPELADEGLLEARLLGRRMAQRPEERPQVVISSTLARAARTAEVVRDELAASGAAPALELDERLIEIGQGDWEGKTHAELARDEPDRYAAWHSGTHRHPPGAEPLDAVNERVSAVLRDVAQRDAGCVALVSHGGTLRVAVSQLLGLGDRSWQVDLDNCSLSAFRPEGAGGWTLERWNDTAHLLGLVELHVDESEGSPLAL